MDLNHRSRWFKAKVKHIADAGHDRATIIIQWNVSSEEEAFATEIRCIAAIGRKDMGKGPLINMTDGGDGCAGRKSSAKHLASLHARKGVIKFPQLQGRKGPAHHNFGRKHPEEVRSKMSMAQKSRWDDNERNKTSERMKANTFRARRWLVTEPDGSATIEVFNLCAFARSRGASGGALSELAKGKRKSHKGFTHVVLIDDQSPTRPGAQLPENVGA